jgi:hypothetical protein
MNKNAPKISEVGDKDLVQFSMDVINSERSKVPGKPTGDIPLFGVFNYKGGESILNLSGSFVPDPQTVLRNAPR